MPASRFLARRRKIDATISEIDEATMLSRKKKKDRPIATSSTGRPVRSSMTRRRYTSARCRWKLS
jgi:hypothetical protein